MGNSLWEVPYGKFPMGSSLWEDMVNHHRTPRRDIDLLTPVTGSQSPYRHLVDRHRGQSWTVVTPLPRIFFGTLGRPGGTGRWPDR